MRWSKMHIPTLRDDPADAGAPSHRLLLRAGYIRQLMAGHYSLLPLGQRVRLKVIGIIREEMDAIGAQEILMPVMHPAELWQTSGRWELMGDELFRLKDRKGADFALGMTHEEIISTLATELESYRELPQMWYQFQTKMRDEPRPKAGLMRTREFTMKDSYSFDLDAAGLDTSFRAHRDAYVRIFERLSVPAVPADASSGAMGGSDSTEFICPSPSGEDLIVLCPECGYAANIEKAASRLTAVDDSERAGLLAAPEPFATPGVRTIEDLAVQYRAPGDRQIKTLVYFLDGVLTLVLLRGDHALNEQKLIDATGANAIRPALPDEIRDALGALPGSLGAVGVSDHPIIADEALRGRRVLVIDDDPRNVFAITSTLELHGVTVTQAPNGRKGIEALLTAEDTDLILMDVMMPEMDGYTTMNKIRQMPAFATLPIIAVTARAMPGDREKSIAAGASDYVTKPVDTDELLSCMERWLSRRLRPLG